MADQVCIDANLAVTRVLREARFHQVRTLFRRWRAAGVGLVAPPMFNAETTSVLRQKVYDRFITLDRGEQGFVWIQRLPVSIQAPAELQPAAWAWAKTLNLRRAYDLQYVALAGLLGCELWTADERLYNGARQRCPWVHWVGEVPLT